MVARHQGSSRRDARGAWLILLEPSEANIREAAHVLRSGGLVVMPTETVYGLACDALNPEAVRKVFATKQRPPDHPLIVHVLQAEDLQWVVGHVPPEALVLATSFWPGPLTLVLHKAESLPMETTGGGATVAVRAPAHPVARAMLAAFGGPIAAPSANLFGRLSATRAEHLDPELLAHVDMVLDGGPCDVGLESSVVDLTVSTPQLLRPGSISAEQIGHALGVPVESGPPSSVKSPGTHPRHYAPRSAVRLVTKLGQDQAGITFEVPANSDQRRAPTNPSEYGAWIYSALHELDQLGLAEIFIEAIPDSPEWDAVRDRLKRASWPV